MLTPQTPGRTLFVSHVYPLHSSFVTILLCIIYKGGGGPEGGSDSGADVPEEDASDAFIAYATSLLMERTLNAKEFCTLMHFASLAGIGKAAAYGLKPGSSSGHYQRRLDRSIGQHKDMAALYCLNAPGHARVTHDRAVRDWMVYPPHELLGDDIDAERLDAVREAVAGGRMPRAYTTHPVVVANPEQTIAPFVMYVDGVPYSILDSIIGVWFSCFLTGKRYLVAVLRKRHLCRCGCRGWCTLWALFDFLRWSLQALADGIMPSQRHDSSPWAASDVGRGERSADPLNGRGCVIYIKGDWAEYASTFGIPPWNDGLRPCFACNASGAELHVFEGCGSNAFAFRENGEDDYDQSCSRCEILVMLDGAAHKSILTEGVLHYDRRSSGSHGRALLNAVPSLGLLPGDRLEPTRFLRD